MRRSSLRLRLFAGAAIAIFLALAICWAGLSLLFHRHVERRESATLVRIGEAIAAGVAFDAREGLRVSPLPADPRFAALASGLYWQASAPGASAQSASLWDQSLAVGNPPAGRWAQATVAGPFGRQLFAVSRTVRPDRSARPVRIVVAEDDSDIRSAYREFNRELAVSLALLWAVLSVAAFVQVSLGLRPLRRVRAELERLRRSPAARLPSDHPHEILPLTLAINDLAEAREGDLARARRRAADLAHSLKTPLAALAAQSRRAREAGAGEAADGLDRAIATMGAALESELARSRAAAARGARDSEQADIAEVVERLIAVLERTERGEAIVFDSDVPPGTRAPVATHDLAEIVGAAVENAVVHARRRVHISAARDKAGTWVCIEDDGPGMEPEQRTAAIERGRRLDETGHGHGHGLGLAIIRDFLEATDGELSLGRAALGGLRVTLHWPVGV